ncbi:TPA: hypothetical protein HA241_06215 [Candidatus Woesearchaeota archaeon]|nr:hypothetical protein [Candidatus Woesearchaeota archaeon]
MEIKKNSYKELLIILLKEFSTKHTVTSLAKELKMSRVGTWKLIKKLEEIKYLVLTSVGTGKTSTYTVDLNWDNIIVEKALTLYLTEETVKQRRWQVNFNELEAVTDFVILYGSILHAPQHAEDIDIVGITSKSSFVKVQKILDKVQKTQSKKIHAINFTESEFKTELQKHNRSFIDATKRGVVLFGQERFFKFMGGVNR